MIRHVFVDENDAAPRVALGQLLQALGVGCPVEHGVLREMEPRLLECDRAKNPLRVPLAGGRDARLFAPRRPRLIQTWILAKTRLVFKHQDRPLGEGFF